MGTALRSIITRVSQRLPKILVVGDASEYEVQQKVERASVIRLTGTSEDLHSKLDYILANWLECVEMSREGPAYIEKYHSPKVIAQSFLEI